jgi:hypothetical protein
MDNLKITQICRNPRTVRNDGKRIIIPSFDQTIKGNKGREEFVDEVCKNEHSFRN